MKKKFNIGTRLILGNTLAIAAVVGSYGYFNSYQIESIFANEAERATSSRMEEVKARGLAEARRIAANAGLALSNNDYGFLSNVLEPLVEADPSLAFAFLIDDSDSLVAKASRSGYTVTSDMVEFEQNRSDATEDVHELTQGNALILKVAVPIKLNDRTWGRVILGYSLEHLTVQLAALDEWRTAEVRKSLAATVISAFLLAFVGILATVLPSMSVTGPILALTRAAERLAKGELGLSVNLKARGELGVLGATFNQMSQQLADLVERAKVTATLEKEVEVAETVQAALIPKPELHEVNELKISGRYIPASQCGGDWWSFFQVSDDETLILIGDVTGHGIPTTLITASVNACCEELQDTTDEMRRLAGTTDVVDHYIEERRSLNYLLRHLNRSISRIGRGQFLMTFSAALVNSRENRLAFASAGHEPPLLLPHDESKSVVPLHVGPSRRLGESPDAEFKSSACELDPGDTVVWYTDGLVDVSNSKQRSFGDGRLIRSLRKHRRGSVDRLAENVLDDVLKFAGGEPAADDMTLVVARRQPNLETRARRNHDSTRLKTTETSQSLSV